MEKNLKIFLDDIREPYKGFEVVRNYSDCLDLIKSNKGNISEISLDHDLGESKTGYDIVKYMVENDIFPEKIYIHSANVVGVQNMFQLLERYAPSNVEICIVYYLSERENRRENG